MRSQCAYNLNKFWACTYVRHDSKLQYVAQMRVRLKWHVNYDLLRREPMLNEEHIENNVHDSA